MVKNTKGGKGSKSIARKSVGTRTSTVLRLPYNELETFAVVTKFYGNMCDIMTYDNKAYKCHIRGKFKGKFKRSSFISVGKIILVGFRHFEEPHFINTDLLHVYELSEYPQFGLIPNYDLSTLISFHNNLSIAGGKSTDYDITFEDEPLNNSLPTISEAIIENDVETSTMSDINFDDI